MVQEITVQDLQAMMCKDNLSTAFIDIRSLDENEMASIKGFRNIPMTDLPDHVEGLKSMSDIICLCHHGVRSQQAANFLSQILPDANVYSVQGGIDAWSRQIDLSVPCY